MDRPPYKDAPVKAEQPDAAQKKPVEPSRAQQPVKPEQPAVEERKEVEVIDVLEIREDAKKEDLF